VAVDWEDAVGKLADLGGTVYFQGAGVDIMLQIGDGWDAAGYGDSLDGAGELILTVEVFDVDIGIRAL
jgi:hypothetical protein